MLLKRSPASEKAVDKFVDSLHDESSPNYHQWLTAQQFGEKFGLAESDIQAVTNWPRYSHSSLGDASFRLRFYSNLYGSLL